MRFSTPRCSKRPRGDPFITIFVFCIPAYLPTCLQAQGPLQALGPPLPAYLPTCLPAYLPTCLPAYLPTYLPTCLPTYLPTYAHRVGHVFFMRFPPLDAQSDPAGTRL